MHSVTFKFWVTLEFSRRHGNLKPKRFDFCIGYKQIDQTCQFRYQWLELFGLLEEIGIKSSVAFLKCFSIYLAHVICINQQSDLLMYSSGQKKGGYSSGTLYHTPKWKGTPPPPRDVNTIKYTKIRLFFAALNPLLQTDALLQGFLVSLRSILSEPSDEKTCLRSLWPVKIQSGLLSYRC